MRNAGRRIKVLLVEDELLISELVSEVFVEHGYDVVTAETARTALALIMNDPEIDVMFTDINLPGDMDGAELARAVRLLRSDLPVVYASGRHNAMTIAPLVSQSLFFSKPYNPDDVCGIIDQLAAH